MQQLITECRSNDFGWLAVRAGIFCNWVEKLILQAKRSVSPHMYEMEAHLPTLDQLRNNAAECIRLAEAASTSRQKSLFIEMADRWLTLAEHAAKTQAR
jgi:anaerobic glycerol-3-phosphate dehydrogenase